MNSSAKQILIGWIYRRIGFLKRGMKKQIKPLAAILRFLDFSIPPYRHFECSEKSSLHSALSFLLRRWIPVFRYHTYDIIPSCKKDPSTSLGMTIRKRRFPNISFIRDVGYPPPYRHFKQNREIFLALCSFLLLSQKVSPFQLSHIRRYTGVPERPLGFARDDVTEVALSKHIRCTLRGINPFPHTVISSAARNLPCILLFLAPFAKGFPFSAVSHTALYQCARKIPRLRSG